MIGTWHGSCFACTCTTSDDKSQRIARDGSPSSRRSSKAARLHPSSLGRAATQSTFDHQKTTHRGHGACHYRDGASRRDALFPADRQGRVHSFAAGSVRFLLPLTQLRNLAGRFGVRSFSSALSQFDGIEAGSSRLVANLIRNRRERAFQALRQRLPDHFKTSASVAFKPSNGAIGIDQNPIGASQDVNDC